MSEDKILTKAQLASLWLGKNWFWVALGLLVIAGTYLSVSYFWNLLKGEPEKEKEKNA